MKHKKKETKVPEVEQPQDKLINEVSRVADAIEHSNYLKEKELKSSGLI